MKTYKFTDEDFNKFFSVNRFSKKLLETFLDINVFKTQINANEEGVFLTDILGLNWDRAKELLTIVTDHQLTLGTSDYLQLLLTCLKESKTESESVFISFCIGQQMKCKDICAIKHITNMKF